jgi:hypothetical protein
MPAFKEKYAIEKEPVQLSDIIEKVPEPYREELCRLQKQLRRLFDNVKRVHQGNRMLIERSMSFQERSFMLLFGMSKQNVRYEKNGKMSQHGEHLIDSVM